MKRVIIYHNPILNDSKAEFSDCSTRYDLLPIIVDDNEGIFKLLSILKDYGYTKKGEHVDIEQGLITLAVPIGKVKGHGMYSNESYTQYIGFIDIPHSDLPVRETLNNKLTKKQMYELINMQSHGISDIAPTVDGKGYYLIKSSWSYYHDLALLGYDRKYFEKKQNIVEEGFDDDSFICSDCGCADARDNCYTYNYTIVGGELFGNSCGCAKKVELECAKDYVLTKDTTPADNRQISSIKRDTIQELEKAKKVKFVERFVTGMTDSRGGSYGGESTRVMTPIEALTEYFKKNPKSKFLVCHDESGQFQTYWSLWKPCRGL